MKLIILQGLPASGKSTWAKDFVKNNKDWVRVNRDDLRNMRGEYWIPKQESLISAWEDFCVRGAFEAGYNVVLDATNLNERYLENWRALAKTYDVSVTTKFFEVDVEECIKRDLQRPNSVGESVIRGMYNKYIKVSLPQYEPDFTKPKAVIFDIDGTLASMSGRSPYDWDRVGEDSPITPVFQALFNYKNIGYKIIIFTGRDGSCQEETLKWLEKHAVTPDVFEIRAAGDTRKDSIVKREMFDKHSAEYKIEAVYDDRDQVVEMWRDLGLQCFQCNYGNF